MLSTTLPVIGCDLELTAPDLSVHGYKMGIKIEEHLPTRALVEQLLPGTSKH